MDIGASIAHYDEHLGDIYVWMCGGMEAALRAGREEIAGWGVPARTGERVLDLGCGFGKHTIPLLEAGARVLAIDASHAMLRLLRASVPPQADVRTRCADIVVHLARTLLRPDAILCVGDTLTHLPGPVAVEELLRSCARLLAPHGRLALSFRDYSQWSSGETQRFEVRAEQHRRVDCTVTVLDEHVAVEDCVRDRLCAGWVARRHRYFKLRLDPLHVEEILRDAGLRVQRLADEGGMTRILATARRNSAIVVPPEAARTP